jgi:hypothetical protein
MKIASSQVKKYFSRLSFFGIFTASRLLIVGFRRRKVVNNGRRVSAGLIIIWAQIFKMVARHKRHGGKLEWQWREIGVGWRSGDGGIPTAAGRRWNSDVIQYVIAVDNML